MGHTDHEDPQIIGNEFEVPQEQTLETEEFYNGLQQQQQQKPAKPVLYVGTA